MVVLMLLIAGARCACGGASVPTRTILELDLERAFVDVGGSGDPIQQAPRRRRRQRLADVVATLERAAADDRVVGLVARVGGGGSGMAATQELRDAVSAFRASGKFAVAFSETFGEFGGGNQGYYLATAFDEIWLQPSGDVGLNGLLAQTRFLRGTLDLLQVDVRMDHRHEYKNALNTYTERAYTPAHSEALGAVLQSMHGQLVRGVADARKLDASAVSALVDRGPFLGPEAAQEKFVDHLGYRDEVYAAVKEKAGAGAQLLYADKYLERAGRPHQRGARIAVDLRRRRRDPRRPTASTRCSAARPWAAPPCPAPCARRSTTH
jgi:protease-4